MLIPGCAKRSPPSAIGSPCQDAQQGRFAGPVAADQRQPLTRRDSEGDAVQDRLVAEVKADAGKRQEGWFSHGLFRWGRGS